MDQVALGKRIKAARERVGMTQEDLAAAVDYSVDHVSVVERGVKPPKLEKLVAIANVLNVGTDELLQDSLNAATMLRAFEDALPRRAAQGDECAGRIDHRIPVTVQQRFAFCRPLFFSTAFDIFPVDSCGIIVPQER